VEEGQPYQGVRYVTQSGRVCQRWDAQEPHTHSYTAVDLQDLTLEDAANYCRNPDNKTGGPWCFTTDRGKEWETCGILSCGATGNVI
jgi:hypothetical protein